MKIEKMDDPHYAYSFFFKFNRNVIDYCKYLSEKYGFRNFIFGGENKWKFTKIEYAVELKDRYPEIEISDDIQVEFELAKYVISESVLATANALRLKQAKESNLEIKGIKGSLLPFQRVGVEFFINSGGRAMNSDPMGSGKSLQALAYVTTSGCKKTLIICPAIVKYNWKNEVNKWTAMKPFVIDSGTTENEVALDVIKADVVVINYDILKKFFNLLTSIEWENVILDEFHYCKDRRTARSKIAKKIIIKIPHIMMLSGTPFLNRPVELFFPLTMLDPKTWNDYYSYTRRYCDGHPSRYGWDDRGASNIAELQTRISPYFIRRTKKEILPDLPEKRFINLPIELDANTQREYTMAEEEFGKFLINIKKKTKEETARSLQAEKLVKLGALRQLTTVGKIDQTKEIIEGIIESGEKVVVFSCYIESLERLHKEFKDISVLVTGKTGSKERNDIVIDFQNNKKIKIFFGGIISAGVGINLTAATNIIFMDYSWRPGDHAQAIDRIHRIGSTASHITIYQLYSKKTIDQYMFKLLEKKQLLFDQIIDGKEIPKEMSKNYARTIINAIEMKQKRKIVNGEKITLAS
jgi:SWI/SNF-related matrix-associated actin-dependent regulator of chromatin subfamily A-like protein 1